mmetsp:Transcript_2845/g.3048  ORF Transcript_2845/g.3048 Transcript_2845/m.3048 type:complete len:296 (-) Transcript_2845:568-1455(-)
MSSEISIHHLKIHPLVIASASDHFTRVQVNGGNISGGNSVIGLLFGSIHDGVLSVNDATDVLIDQSNHIDEREVEKKRNLWTAVYPTYQLVGWYAFDRAVSAYHYKVHQTISKFFPQAVFLLFHTQQSTDEQSLDKIPMTAYLFETVTNQSQKAFIEKNYSIDSTDVEKIALDEIIKSIPNKEGATKLDIHTSSLITSIQLLRNKITFPVNKKKLSLVTFQTNQYTILVIPPTICNTHCRLHSHCSLVHFLLHLLVYSKNQSLTVYSACENSHINHHEVFLLLSHPIHRNRHQAC